MKNLEREVGSGKVDVMFICNRLGGGGAERVITVLGNEFIRSNKKVAFCVFHKTERCYDLSHDITVIYPQKGKAPNSKFEKIKWLRETIKKHEPATIVSFEYFVNLETILAARGQGAKIIVSERNDPAKKGGKYPVKAVRDFLYLLADHLICQTPDAKAYFNKWIQKHTTVIPNPVKPELPEKWRGPRNKEIVNFCRLERQKNLPLLIDAFEKVSEKYPDHTLQIFGDGKEKNHLEAYIREKGLTSSVFLQPAIPDIHQRVLKSAMFVSSSDYEGLSNSMLEAMAIGLPVICTDCPCGGAQMMIEDGVNGLLVPINDVDSLSRAMCRMIENQAAAEEMGEKAAAIRDKLRVDNIVAQWAKIMGMKNE